MRNKRKENQKKNENDTKAKVFDECDAVAMSISMNALFMWQTRDLLAHHTHKIFVIWHTIFRLQMTTNMEYDEPIAPIVFEQEQINQTETEIWPYNILKQQLLPWLN